MIAFRASAPSSLQLYDCPFKILFHSKAKKTRMVAVVLSLVVTRVRSYTKHHTNPLTSQAVLKWSNTRPHHLILNSSKKRSKASIKEMEWVTTSESELWRPWRHRRGTSRGDNAIAFLGLPAQARAVGEASVMLRKMTFIRPPSLAWIAWYLSHIIAIPRQCSVSLSNVGVAPASMVYCWELSHVET